jgi:hypothetical protein
MNLSEEFSMDEAKKVQEYLASNEQPKIKIAHNKIDKFLHCYLKYLTDLTV